jgi:adenosylcobinamide-GDP ribazoletransferase
MVVTAAAFPYARAEGLGAGYRQGASGSVLVVAVTTATGAAVFTLGAGGLLLLGIATLVSLSAGAWSQRFVGGVTGDVFGAVCELSETFVLLAGLMLAERGVLDPWLLR